MPFGHGRHEFTGIAFGVPFAGVGIGPPGNRIGVSIVENTLNEPRVQEQSFELVPVPETPGVRRFSVEVKLVADD
jgi:hypothetical protein